MPKSAILATNVNPGGLTALIQNLGRDCHPTQFLREFSKNALEACQRSGGSDCKVIVDYNAALYDATKLHKMCFIDTGDGMSPDQMLSLLNNLSASGASKNQFQNYGVGAKISALTRNHAGIQYESWKDGVGYMILIKFDSEQGIYGIQGIPSPDGKTLYAIELPAKDKPKEITDHGTRVTLWGMEDQQDTMMPPTGINGIRESWISFYLNTRFFRIPKGVTLSARIGYYRDNNPKHNYLLTIRGQKAILDEKADLKGTVNLSDAKLYWWVMPKGSDGHGREMLKGHTALVHEDELFDMSDSRSNRIAYFGVIVGRDRVIIYVEPTNVVQNTSRTNLLRPDGSPVLWEIWQDEFRANMPQPLKKFLEDLQNENALESHTDSIKEKLKGLQDLYKLSRYKASLKGNVFADPESESTFETGNIRVGEENSFPSESPQPGKKPGALSTELLTALVQQNTGSKANAVEPDPFPRVEWVSANDGNEGLLDRAAEYIHPQNLILANSDYQGLHDLVKYISKGYTDMPEVTKLIADEVKQAFELALTECVAGALSLKNRPYWNPDQFNAAISREALTTSVMPRYWMISSLRRILGSKIKGFVETPST